MENTKPKLPKLVRDRIPQIIEETNSTCSISRVRDIDEHEQWLLAKLLEEADEFIEKPSYQEAADLVEVVKTFCYLHQLEWDAVLDAAESKEETHGGFRDGVILDSVDYRMKDG